MIKRSVSTGLLLSVFVALVVGFMAILLSGPLAWDGTGVGGSALGLLPVAFEMPGLQWSNRPEFPSMLREVALLRWVGILGVALLLLVVTAAVPAFFGGLLAGRTIRRVFMVHRDMGASARTLRTGVVRAVLGLVMVAAVLAALISWFVTGGLARSWPEVWLANWKGTALFMLVGTVVAATLGGALAVWRTGGLLERLVRARSAPIRSVGSLSLLQVAASTVLLVLAVAVLRDARPAPATASSAVGGRWWVGLEARTPIDSAALIRALKGVPTVAAAGAATPGGWEGLGVNHHVLTECGNCLIGGLPTPMLGGRARIIGVAGDALALLGVQVLEGEAVGAPAEGAPPAAMVSERFGARMFERGEAVGRTVFIGSDLAPHQIQSIVSDAPQVRGLGAPGPHGDRVYLSLAQHPVPVVELVVQGTLEPSALEGVLAVNLPDATRIDVRSFEEHRARAAAPMTWISRVLLSLLVGALMLSVLTALLNARLQVRELRFEIALRRALGAPRGRIAGWVLGGLMGRTGLGVLLGLWTALFFQDPLSHMLGGEIGWVGAMVAAATVQLVAGLLGALPSTIRASGQSPLHGLELRAGAR